MILRNVRSIAMEYADYCSLKAGLTAIGAGIWLQEKGILKSGGNMGDGIVNMIIGAMVSCPVTVPLGLAAFLLNRIFYTAPLRREAALESQLQREADNSRRLAAMK